MAGASIIAGANDLVIGCVEFLGNDHVFRLRKTNASNAHCNFDILLMECDIITEPDKLRSE
jgi:hypothetical protein